MFSNQDNNVCLRRILLQAAAAQKNMTYFQALKYNFGNCLQAKQKKKNQIKKKEISFLAQQIQPTEWL